MYPNFDPDSPGPTLLRSVRGGLLLNQDMSFERWCRTHGVVRQYARTVLLGLRNGPKARALRQRLIEAATAAPRRRRAA